MTEARLSSDLPERFARLYDPQSGLFETPLDDRGIADIDALCELAIRTYPEDAKPLSFSHSERNVHHVYRTEEFWKQFAEQHTGEDRLTVRNFRDSTPQKLYIPIPLHAWIEKVTLPPPPPSLEVMRRRNEAWASASVLLRGAVLLDQAREEYDTKKDSVRKVYGNIPGHTPRSMQRPEPIREEPDREYWLSELNRRLDGWRKTAELGTGVPREDRFVTDIRLWSVRALGRRIRRGAMVPDIPHDLLAA